jgi:hypothetical protein
MGNIADSLFAFRRPRYGIIATMKDGDAVADAIERMGRAGRTLATGALKEGSAETLAAVKAGIQDVSGALRAATRVYVGRGDWPGRYSVYIAAAASRQQYARRLVRIGRWSRAFRVYATGRPTDRYGLFYWRFREFGHRIGQRSNTPSPNADQIVGKKEFIRPGFDRTVDGALDTIEERVLDGTMNEFTT